MPLSARWLRYGMVTKIKRGKRGRRGPSSAKGRPALREVQPLSNSLVLLHGRMLRASSRARAYPGAAGGGTGWR
eukprot:360003-Chlamydomonas_euryale.AAC.6